jgi:hypothetical protein
MLEPSERLLDDPLDFTLASGEEDLHVRVGDPGGLLSRRGLGRDVDDPCVRARLEVGHLHHGFLVEARSKPSGRLGRDRPRADEGDVRRALLRHRVELIALVEARELAHEWRLLEQKRRCRRVALRKERREAKGKEADGHGGDGDEPRVGPKQTEQREQRALLGCRAGGWRPATRLSPRFNSGVHLEGG